MMRYFQKPIYDQMYTFTEKIFAHTKEFIDMHNVFCLYLMPRKSNIEQNFKNPFICIILRYKSHSEKSIESANFSRKFYLSAYTKLTNT